MALPAWWPVLSAEEVSASSGRVVATDLLRRAGLAAGLSAVGRLCALGQVDVTSVAFSTRSIESLVLPGSQPGRLVVGVSTAPTKRPSDPLFGEPPRTRLAFRVAHELGHALTFDRRDGNTRRRSQGDQQEEVFCDAFALGILLAPNATQGLPATARAIHRAAAASAVPLRLLLREMLTAHPTMSASVMTRHGNPIWNEAGVDACSPPQDNVTWRDICPLPGGRYLAIDGVPGRPVQLVLGAIAA